MQSASNHSVDLVLALVIAAGSTIGAQLGARLSKHLRGEQLLIVLGVLALAVGLKMAVGIALPPSNPLSQSGAQAVLRADHNPALAFASGYGGKPVYQQLLKPDASFMQLGIASCARVRTTATYAIGKRQQNFAIGIAVR